MQRIDIFQIDAFTDKVFHGNPAAICLLKEWLNDELLQAIAVENNLSETAFVMENGQQGYQIRWFTPRGEVNLSGHATLAAGYLLYELDKWHNGALCFSSLGGDITIRKTANRFTMDFPRLSFQLLSSPEQLTQWIDTPVVAVFESELDYLVLLADEAQVLNVKINHSGLKKLKKRGLIVTAPGLNADFYSRCFYPKHDIFEDPVTGSAHCVLAPFWAERLGKKTLHGMQGSLRRGDVFCEVRGDRVDISGSCKWYSKGYLMI